MYLIHASTSSFSSMGSTSIAITREHTTRVGLGATAQTRQKRTLAAPPPQRPSPLGMSSRARRSTYHPRSTRCTSPRRLRGARRGSAAAVRWISAPRAETNCDARASTRPSPPRTPTLRPSRSPPTDSSIPPPPAQPAPDPRRRSRAGARAPSAARRTPESRSKQLATAAASTPAAAQRRRTRRKPRGAPRAASARASPARFPFDASRRHRRHVPSDAAPRLQVGGSARRGGASGGEQEVRARHHHPALHERRR